MPRTTTFSMPDRSSLRSRLFLATTLALLGCAAFTVDLAAARACRNDPATGRNAVPKEVRRLLTLAEVFAHGAGVVGILVTVAVLDAQRRRQLPRLLAASLGAGLTADLVKWLLVSRRRPASADLAGSAFDTFVALLPRWSDAFAQQAYTREFQSFPSAHSATAAGLAVGLATYFPQGRYWFALLAGLAMLQRIDAGAHFPSDTLWGAALGVAVAAFACAGQPAEPPVGAATSVREIA